MIKTYKETFICLHAYKIYLNSSVKNGSTKTLYSTANLSDSICQSAFIHLRGLHKNVKIIPVYF